MDIGVKGKLFEYLGQGTFVFVADSELATLKDYDNYVNGREIEQGKPGDLRSFSRIHLVEAVLPASFDCRLVVDQGQFNDEKGAKFGLCNRSDCLKPGAAWYNHSTRKHYCADCADMINRANARDSFVIDLGHPLCTPWDPDNKPLGTIDDRIETHIMYLNLLLASTSFTIPDNVRTYIKDAIKILRGEA